MKMNFLDAVGEYEARERCRVRNRVRILGLAFQLVVGVHNKILNGMQHIYYIHNVVYIMTAFLHRVLFLLIYFYVTRAKQGWV